MAESRSFHSGHGKARRFYPDAVHADFVRLYASSFLNAANTYLILILMAVVFYERTGSLTWAASSFAMQWIASIFVALLLRVVRVANVRLELLDLISLASLMILAINLDNIVIVMAMMFIRLATDFAARAGRQFVIKKVSEASTSRLVPWYFSSQYLGAATGTLLATVGQVADLKRLAIAGLLSFLSMVLVWYLHRKPEALRSGAPTASGGGITWTPVLRSAFLFQLTATVCFQGLHNVLRVGLPEYLGKVETFVGPLQIVATTGIITGSIIGSFRGLQNALVTLPYTIGAGSLLLLGFTISLSEIQILTIYFAGMAAFEIVYVIAAARMISAARQDEVMVVTSTAQSLQMFGMMVVTYLGSLLLDVAPGGGSLALIAALPAAGLLLTVLLSRP